MSGRPGRPKASLHDFTAETTEHSRRIHERRVGGWDIPDPQGTPELAAAYRSLQLHWIDSIPGYREQVQAKVAEAMRAEAKRRRANYGGQPIPGRLVLEALAPALAVDDFETLLDRAGVTISGRHRHALNNGGTIPLDLADRLLTKGLGDPGALYRILSGPDVDNLGQEIDGCG